MTVYNNTTTSQSYYSSNSGISDSDPFVTLYMDRDPTSNDVSYPIQKRWQNTNTADEWILLALPVVASIKSAVWQNIGNSLLQVETLTGDDGAVISATNHNINILGSAVANGTNAKPVYTEKTSTSTMSIEVQVTDVAASSAIDNAGLASFNSTEFSADSNGFVTSNNFSVVAGTGLNGGGSLTLGGTTTLNLTIPVAASHGGTGVDSPTAHTLPVAEGSSAFNFLGPLTNGQLLIGSTGADPVPANITSNDGSVTITNGAGTINLSTSAIATRSYFTAYATVNQNNVTGDGTDYTVIYDTTEVNQGSNYSTTTGLYTAPANDMYTFFANAQVVVPSGSGTDIMNGHFVVTGLSEGSWGVANLPTQNQVSGFVGFNNDIVLGGSITIPMNTGDTIGFRVSADSSPHGSGMKTTSITTDFVSFLASATYFCGYRLNFSS